MAQVAPSNEEAREAWNGVLFDRFLAFRDLVTTGLGSHGEAALAAHPPRPGERVLDIGCGFGDTAQRIADMVGSEGSVLGVDVAERFIALAREEAAEAGRANVRFEVVDVQTAEFGERFSYAFSRFGTMFFANPAVAMRNVHDALDPDGRLCMVVWRQKADNEWLHRAELVVKDFVEPDPDSDEPTCGPGPFSMAGEETTTGILESAGFRGVALERCDIDIKIGNDMEQAIEMVCALGPAGEAIRLAGDQANEVRDVVEARLRVALADFVRAEGVLAPASTWIVTATA